MARANDSKYSTSVGIQGLFEPLEQLTERYGTKSPLQKIANIQKDYREWTRGFEPADETEIPF
jgi:hypothetical protein